MTTGTIKGMSVSRPDERAGGTWRIHYHDVVESTMSLARGLPAWSAVLADVQTAGRGQAGRQFVSDRGGVYLTAVLPYGGDAAASRGFALAVGWAVREALHGLGVRGLRLKWPNDLMIGRAKVGGILVEQGARDTLLVGVGLNVTNRPWESATELAAAAGSMAQAMGDARALPSRDAVAPVVLEAIARAHAVFALEGLAGLSRRLCVCWGGVREVEVRTTDGSAPVRGSFLGLDADGALHLIGPAGESVVVPAHRVERLLER